MSGTMIEKVDLSLISVRDTTHTGLSQKKRPYDEKFVDWLLVRKGRRHEFAVWEGYRIAKVQRETGLSIMTEREADEAARLILSSNYQKSTKRHKLFAIEDWMLFHGIEVKFRKPRASERCPHCFSQEQLRMLIPRPNRKTGKMPTEEEYARWERIQPIMDELLQEKGLVKVAAMTVHVTDLKGPLEDGWQKKVEEFATTLFEHL